MPRLQLVHLDDFQSGEVDPRSRDRVGDKAFQTGLAKARNCLIDVQSNLVVRNPGIAFDDPSDLLNKDISEGITTIPGSSITRGQFFRFSTNSPGIVLKGLVQAPPVEVPHPDWIVTRVTGQFDWGRRDDTGVVVRGIAPNQDERVEFHSALGQSTADVDQEKIFIESNSTLKYNELSFKMTGVYQGDGDAYPRMRIWDVGYTPEAFTNRRDGRRQKVTGEQFLQTLSGVTFYYYSRINHRMYRFDFDAAELDLEYGDVWRRDRASSSDEIRLAWKNVTDADNPFRLEHEGADNPDRNYNFAVGKRGMKAADVFPYRTGKQDLLVNFIRQSDSSTAETVTMSDLPTGIKMDVYLLPDVEEGPFWRVTMDTSGHDPGNPFFVTGYDSVKTVLLDDRVSAHTDETKIIHSKWTSYDDGVTVFQFRNDGVLFYDQQSKTRMPGWVPFETEVDVERLRFAADNKGVLVVHPEIEPLYLRRLGNGVFAAIKPTYYGLPDDFKPGATEFYQNRLYFAGTDDEPTGIWASRAGSPNDFDWRVADQSKEDSPFFTTLSEGRSRIHNINMTNFPVFETEETLWFRVGEGPISPQDFNLRNSGERGSDQRSPSVGLLGQTAFMNAGLDAAMVASFADETRGFVTEQMSLPNSHLFHSEGKGFAVAQHWDGSGEGFYLTTTPGNGKLVVTTILPGTLLGSTVWDFDILKQRMGDTIELPDGKKVLRGGEPEDRAVPILRPVLGHWGGEGEVWVVLPGETGKLVMQHISLKTMADNYIDEGEDVVEAEIETLPVILPSNPGTGPPGSSFRHPRRIVDAFVTVDGKMDEDGQAHLLVEEEWRAITEPGQVKFYGLSGYSDKPTFGFYTDSPLRITLISLNVAYTT